MKTAVATQKSMAATLGNAPAGALQRQCSGGQHTLIKRMALSRARASDLSSADRLAL